MTRKNPSRKQMSFLGFDDEVTDNGSNDSNSRSLPQPSQIAESAKELPDRSAVKTAQAGRPVTAGPVKADDLVILVDSHSLIYQVFHAMPTMTAPDGTEVGAIHGFLRDLAELRDRYDPDFLLCAFDVSDVTFRTDAYPAYKAHREPMPAALAAQIPRIHESLGVLGIPCLFLNGFEADDLLATLSRQAEQVGARTLLVTSDKDCRQLLSDQTKMLNLRKGTEFGPAELLDDWGIRPEQVIDFQAMVGDSVDNVPGVPKIGPKAAKELLGEFGSLDNIYANLDKITAAARRKTLEEHRDQAYMSQHLVALKRDVPMLEDWSTWRRPSADHAAVENLFQKLGFRRLAERFLQSDTVSESAGAYAASSVDRSSYRCIDSLTALQSLVSEIRQQLAKAPDEDRWLSIDTETTSTSPAAADLAGVALAWKDARPVYIPVLGPAEERARLVSLEDLIRELGPLLADSTIKKVGQNIKYDMIVFENHGMPVENVAFDTMLADYLCSPGDRNHSLDEISKRYLRHEMIPITSLIGTGKNQTTIDQSPLAAVTEYAAEDADVAFQLLPIMQKRLHSMNVERVYYDVELPLIRVLADMEKAGIAIDQQRLAALGNEFEAKISDLRRQILQFSDGEFNPDSPKQLATVLFDELGLRVVKKTKSGASTDVEVLQELAQEHPLPALLIEYRQATKLKSTYIDALPKLINPKSGRVHTSFRQDVAATGRLSSTEPNLQNIPIRTEDGRRIRSAFRAEKTDWSLLAADYSQIELRMMAHFCGDQTLTAAFHHNEDIHATVAAEVYGVSPTEVNSEQRRSAKAINFGILYGQSPFGLAKTLSIPKDAAAEFIDAYFERFSGVRNFMLETLAQARSDGFVSTMLGRRRYLNGIRDFSKLNSNQQKTLLEPERMAINTVIQGSAADLIKIAMIRVHQALRESQLNARLLLQIHDELLLEVHDDHIEAASALLRREMNGAASLSVPLEVDINAAKSWDQC